jgi:predicted molibdopterin-dependent oxidoreductase YjgC
MFKRLNKNKGKSIDIKFEGKLIQAMVGDTVAAALMVAGINKFHNSPVSEEPRGPYCMMGVCFECLVEIDGVGHQQACLVSVKDGMVIKREETRRQVVDDL